MKRGLSNRLASSLPFLAGAVAVASGVVVFPGWALDIAGLKSVLPSSVPTAVLFTALGVAVVGGAGPRTPGCAHRFGPAFRAIRRCDLAQGCSSTKRLRP